MTHSYVCHDSFICAPWLIHMCAMTNSYVCHDSFICVPWLIHMCAIIHSHLTVWIVLRYRQRRISVKPLHGWLYHRSGQNPQQSALKWFSTPNWAASWLLRIFICWLAHLCSRAAIWMVLLQIRKKCSSVSFTVILHSKLSCELTVANLFLLYRSIIVPLYGWLY